MVQGNRACHSIGMAYLFTDHKNWITHIDEARARGIRIAMVCGGFELLHAGHVAALETAKSSADYVVAGVRGDKQIETQKGKHRPLINAKERAEFLETFEAVDLVIILDEGDEAQFAAALKPNVYVTGDDAGLPTLPESTEIIVIPATDKGTDSLIEAMARLK